MIGKTPEEQAQADAHLRAAEDGFADEFRDMDSERFIEQGVAIFRSATEGIPSVNEGADNALRTLLTAITSGEAPKPFMGGKTAAAWRMYTGELFRRVALVEDVDFYELPSDYEHCELPTDLGGLPAEEYKSRLLSKWEAIHTPQAVNTIE